MIVGGFPWQKRNKISDRRSLQTDTWSFEVTSDHEGLGKRPRGRCITQCLGRGQLPRSRQKKLAECFPQQYNQFPSYLFLGEWAKKKKVGKLIT